MKVIVTGAAGSIGSRLCRRLAECGVSVLALDKARVTTAPEVDHRVVDLATAKLGPLFAGADAVVHLGSPFPADAPSTADSAGPLAVAERVFAAAGESGVAHAIILSTAMVYGAWPNNAVPLTEEAPVRPNPDFAFAVYHAEFERRAFEWRADNAHATLAVLRPVPLVADEQPSRSARLLRSMATVRTDEGDAPAQYLHVDDLVEAVIVALRAHIDGVLNVAPDGWISPETLGLLAYPGPRPMLPRWAVDALAKIRWRFGLAGAPPGLVPYTVHPWVVGNDRLRSLGWQAANTNEEAYVLGHQPTPLDKLTSRRRQQIALGVTGGVVAAIAAATTSLIIRRTRRRRRASGIRT
ncbi:MAG TPA: NAD-dependent epimerase/dehydratase family protein [Acidimicrobiales bacterium]|nr:NAD-dependent epimerase/dehydratase family protein [Acidimicrobiales bacterium]